MPDLAIAIIANEILDGSKPTRFGMREIRMPIKKMVHRPTPLTHSFIRITCLKHHFRYKKW